jgi:hypothetical protein
VYQKSLLIPPRRQWSANYGYCGETSLICAGLYFGQYVSQYDARAFASGPIRQTRKNSQLLLGPEQNGRHAAESMRLTSSQWDSNNQTRTHDFLAWIKQQIVSGFPVAIGVYMNQSCFPDDECSDSEYDHIVLVYGVASVHPLTDLGYDDDDVIFFSDHGLYLADKSESRKYLFGLPFRSFQKKRTDANRSTAPVYTVATVGKNVKNYGLALTGTQSDGTTLPVRAATNKDHEFPEIRQGLSVRPKPTVVQMSVTVSGLIPGERYQLYRYDSMSKVPKSTFNGHASNAAKAWTFQSECVEMCHVDEILSSEIAVYRAVKTSAP